MWELWRVVKAAVFVFRVGVSREACTVWLATCCHLVCLRGSTEIRMVLSKGDGALARSTPRPEMLSKQRTRVRRGTPL